MTSAEPNADDLLERASDARQHHDEQASVGFLRAYIQRGRALLWLAKLTPEPLEALSAAELAFRLDPTDEVAQRAILAARERIGAIAPKARTRDELSAAVVLTTGMTLREARAVIWPFRDINQPIGDALDAGLITLRDLGWALEHRQGRILTAARTILFTQIASLEPATLPQPLRVISGSRYAEYQERRSLILAIFAASAALAICAALVLIGITSLWFRIGWVSWVALLILVPLARYLERQMDRLNETATSYRLGRWGEERIVENLRALLDDRWTLFRNFTWPDHGGGDIDMVLVGPGGVLAFEVKTYAGEIRNIEDQWQRRGKRGWYKLFSHPGKQARYSAVRLQKFLTEHLIMIDFVQPVVMWASSSTADFETEGTITIERPKTPVWKTEELSDRIERLIQEDPVLSSDMVNQIVVLLTSTVTESRRQERQKNQRSRQPRTQTKSN
jgi:hypothetical protein